MEYKKTKLTSVNVNHQNRKEFKKIAIDEEITFQKLVNIALEMYVNDDRFRKMINKRR